MIRIDGNSLEEVHYYPSARFRDNEVVENQHIILKEDFVIFGEDVFFVNCVFDMGEYSLSEDYGSAFENCEFYGHDFPGQIENFSLYAQDSEFYNCTFYNVSKKYLDNIECCEFISSTPKEEWKLCLNRGDGNVKKTLKNEVEELAQKHKNAIFLVDGDSMRGDIYRIKSIDQTKVIYLRDYMAVGSAAPEILSEEFVRMRVAALSGAPYGEYTVEEYERENASELRKLLEMKGAEIILLQYDCYVSQIWQLTMQAYIEQEKLAKGITRVIVCEGEKSFLIKGIRKIDIQGSHSAYCELVCNHKVIDLSRYLISKEAIEYYLDINSEVGNLTKYICEVSSGFEDPYTACGMFLHDFQEGGLGDREFLQIAYKTLSEKTEHQDVIKKWNKERKRRNLS